MMNIELWHVGSTKTGWIASGEQEYIRRCKRFAKITVRHLSPGRRIGGEAIRQAESATIISALQRADKVYTILLDERGQQMGSVEFAERIQAIADTYGPRLRFVTGGSHGVTEDMRSKCDLVLSLSPMVLTHEMVRLFLLEQLYRAFSILRGEKYHHI